MAAEQIRVICESEKFAKSLNINAADISYGVARYISKVSEISSLVNVLRVRHENKVWTSEYRETGGTPQIYGTEYRLIEESVEKKYRIEKMVWDEDADQKRAFDEGSGV